MSADMTSTERERRDEAHAVPDAERGGVREVRDAVTWLLCGTDTLHALPPLRRGIRHCTLGSAPGQDIVIPSPYVSAQHCRLVRTRLGLRVVDRGSENGTYFEGRRKRSFYLEPGKVFTVGARVHRVLALDDEMYAHYPALAAILGYEDERAIPSETPSPSDLIAAAVAGSHML
ncbi:MAG TPA: FHA domain-containing protein, partial [Kofleriaceae bacterium]